MGNPLEDGTGRFLVLKNDAGDFSLWPGTRPVPPGWSPAESGNREECLAWVDSHWTQMRAELPVPASKRRP